MREGRTEHHRWFLLVYGVAFVGLAGFRKAAEEREHGVLKALELLQVFKSLYIVYTVYISLRVYIIVYDKSIYKSKSS